MTPTIDDQGNTYRCGAFAVRQWFEGYGYTVVGTTAFAKYVALADNQKGLAFNQVHDFVTELATELKLDIRWLADGYLKDFATLQQAIKDAWCVVVGVQEADLEPGQNYYHYIDLYGNGTTDTVSVADSFHKYDGEQGTENFDKIQQAIKDNWDQVLIGLAFQFAATPAPTPSVNDDIVTILSVIGDKSYQNPPDLVGIQALVQQAKHLLGA